MKQMTQVNYQLSDGTKGSILYDASQFADEAAMYKMADEQLRYDGEAGAIITGTKPYGMWR